MQISDEERDKLILAWDMSHWIIIISLLKLMSGSEARLLMCFYWRGRRFCKMEESSPTKNNRGEYIDSNLISLKLPTKHRTSLVDGGSLTPASKFKGVVSQTNGHWGAQIYANHQRIWLGTFKSEKEAAMAYDSAAIKLRNGLANRNFQWTEITVREPSFQDQFTTDAVLSMIKDGSYASKFSDFLRAQDQHGLRMAALPDPPDSRLRQLFQKELTPSDVGKLNRLVIPKKYALKYFPKISDGNAQNSGGNVDDMELVFFERSMRSWNFRDRVVFSSYEHNGQKLCILDVVKDGRSRDDDNGNGDEDEEEASEVKTEAAGEMGEESSLDEIKENVSSVSSTGIRLFGVHIV